jgi:hypothetical protein
MSVSNNTQLLKLHGSLLITMPQETSVLNINLSTHNAVTPCTTVMCVLHYLQRPTLTPCPVMCTQLSTCTQHTVCLSPAIRESPIAAWRWLAVGLARYIASLLFSRSTRDFMLFVVFILPAFSTASNSVCLKGVLRTSLFGKRVQNSLSFQI